MTSIYHEAAARLILRGPQTEKTSFSQHPSQTRRSTRRPFLFGCSTRFRTYSTVTKSHVPVAILKSSNICIYQPGRPTQTTQPQHTPPRWTSFYIHRTSHNQNISVCHSHSTPYNHRRQTPQTQEILITLEEHYIMFQA